MDTCEAIAPLAAPATQPSLEHAPLPMMMLDGEDHVVRFVNDAFCRLLDQPAEELLGKTFCALLPRNADCAALLERVYRSGKPESHTGTQDAKLHPVFWSYTAWPLIEQGCTTGVIVQVAEHAQLQERTLAMNEALLLGSVRQHELIEAADAANAALHDEITERKRTEAALRESEERARTLFELGPVAIHSCDATGTIREFNDRAVELWGREPAPHKPDQRYCGPFRLLNPDGSELPHDRSPMADVLRGRIPEARDIEALVERADGTRLTLVVNIRPLKDGRGYVTGAINCFYDISARKQAEEMLRNEATRKTEFLALLAHELRNPLAPMRYGLEVVKRADGKPHLMEPAIGAMERQLAQMTRLVDDLLDVGRISGAKLDLRRVEVELASIFHHLIEASSPVCAAARQELTLTLPSQPVYLHADPVRLTQVFGNLINNACKFTAPGGRISLAARMEGAEVVVRVKDTGIGIAPEMLGKVFDIFTQGDQSLERAQGGLGLGLTLVRRLVEMHGGTVQAHSAGLGNGSEFVVRLPAMTRRPAVVVDPPELAADVAVDMAPRRILVVDDNHDTANTLQLLLKLTGHQIHTAFDGLEAVAAAESFRPDLILLDLGLPKLNGFEAARRIRAQPWARSMVLVAMTGWGQEEDRKKTAAAGFNGHLVKPVGYAALTRLVASVQPVVSAA